MSLAKVFDANALLRAWYTVNAVSGWKESTQRFEMYLLENIRDIQKDWQRGTLRFEPTHDFIIHERGHTRLIRSHPVRDRVILTSYCDNVLLPAVRTYLHYDNTASQRNKGISLARRRFAVHLNQMWQAGSGYVRFFDFSKYFDNIDHGLLLEQFERVLDADEIMLLEMLLDLFVADLSFLPAEEFNRVRCGVYNSLDYVGMKSSAGRQLLHKGVGIGSPASQVAGVFFPTPLDNLCKCHLGIGPYGRYMDDFYIGGPDVATLDRWTEPILRCADSLKLHINEKKVRTHQLGEEMTWLKVVYRVEDDGRIIKRMHSSTVARERRRLRKHAEMVSDGRMQAPDVEEWYKSWRGSYEYLDSGAELHKMDLYLSELMKNV